MLVIPETIEIQFVDENNAPLYLNNLLIGIQTFATHKNNIHLSPFLSDNLGLIRLTKREVKEAEMNFVEYGLMDYDMLENANPLIEIKFWTSGELESYTSYWRETIRRKENRNLEDDPIYKRLNGEHQEVYTKESHRTLEREKHMHEKYVSCRNRDFSVLNNQKIVGNWDGSRNEFSYKIPLQKKTAG